MKTHQAFKTELYEYSRGADDSRVVKYYVDCNILSTRRYVCVREGARFFQRWIQRGFDMVLSRFDNKRTMTRATYNIII